LMKLLFLLVSLLLFSAIRGDDDEPLVHFRWQNDSPYVFIMEEGSMIPSGQTFISEFPVVIAPYSVAEFSFSKNMTCLDCLNIIEYEALLGNIGDIPNIIAGIDPILEDFQSLVKRMGTFQIHYKNEGSETTTVGIVVDSGDIYTSNITFFNTSFLFKAGSNPWYYSEGIVRVVGDPLLVNLTIVNTSRAISDLVQFWQKVDPERKGPYMLNLQECMWSGSSQDFDTVCDIIDDFDDTYNSVGWTLGKTLNANLDAPLLSYDSALVFYNNLGYVETDCAEDENRNSSIKPTIALYCIPTNDSETNGGCKEPDYSSASASINNYTHIAIKHPNYSGKWSSKFADGPLLTHPYLENLTGGSNCSTGPLIGRPVLCFRTPINIQINLINQSPYYFAVENITLYNGDWKDSRPPHSRIEPLLGTDTYEVVDNEEIDGLIWYSIWLGDEMGQSSKMMGYFSVSFYTSSKGNNDISIYDTVVSNDTDHDLLDLTYSTQTGKEGSWKFLSVSTTGYPLIANITGNWTSFNNTASDLLEKWQSRDPANKGSTLQEIASCIFQREIDFNESKVIDDFADDYNSFGWTIGDTLHGNFQNPANSYEEAVAFYQGYNYTVSDCNSINTSIALFCNLNVTDNNCIENYDVIWGSYNYSHAALKLSTGEWSSKFWSGPLLTHPDLASLSGSNCSKVYHLPTFIGSPVLCFEKSHFQIEEEEFFTLTRRVNKSNSPPKGLGIFDFSTRFIVQNESPYSLVLAYTNLAEQCKWYWPWSCQYNLPQFGGIKVTEGALTNVVAGPFILPRNEGSVKLTDIETFSGTAGSLTYDIVLGDFSRYYVPVVENTSNQFTTLGTVTFSAACPYSGANRVSVSQSTINFDGKMMLEKFPAWDLAKIKAIPMISISFKSQVDDNPVVDSGVNPSDHPVQAWFNVKPVTTLGTLVNTYISVTLEQKGWGFLTFSLRVKPLIDQYVKIYGGSYSPSERSPFVDCKKNQKLCNAKVLDDWTDVYNCAAWASGITKEVSEEASTGSLRTRASAVKWFTNLGFVEANCSSSTQIWILDPEVTLVLFCTEDKNKNCIKNQDDVFYNHVAIKEEGVWSSKLGTLALVQHDNPTEVIPGYGGINLCFKGKRKPKQHLTEQTKSHYQFPQSHLDFIEQLIAEVPHNYQEIFHDLFFTWWFSVTQTLPGGIFTNTTISEEMQSREELIGFIQKYPAVTHLLVKKLINSNLWFEYRVFEAVTGENCSEITKNFRGPGHECARNWIWKYKNTHNILHTISF
jgi:hypothetical protein